MRAEPWLLPVLSRDPFLQPYLADSTDNLNVFVTRREGMHMEATEVVKTLEAVYLDTANLLSSAMLPSKVSRLLVVIVDYIFMTFIRINTVHYNPGLCSTRPYRANCSFSAVDLLFS